jgi:hypothetical protein
VCPPRLVRVGGKEGAANRGSGKGGAGEQSHRNPQRSHGVMEGGGEQEKGERQQGTTTHAVPTVSWTEGGGGHHVQQATGTTPRGLQIADDSGGRNQEGQVKQGGVQVRHGSKILREYWIAGERTR